MNQESWVDLAIEDGSRMRAFTAVPSSGWNRGLLLFQEAFGVNPHIRDLAWRLAREGYTVIAPELYHRTAPGFEADYGDFPAVKPHFEALSHAGLSADIQAAYAWLAAREGLSGRISAIGFCLGGRVAWLAAALQPLRAAVSFYGGGIHQLLEFAPRLSAPMLFFWGEQDSHIPPDQRHAVDQALLAAQKPFVTTAFSQAGHGFFCDARPSFHAASARLAWRQTLAFFNEAYVSK